MVHMYSTGNMEQDFEIQHKNHRIGNAQIHLYHQNFHSSAMFAEYFFGPSTTTKRQF